MSQQNADPNGPTADLVAESHLEARVSIWHWFSNDQALTATTLSQRCGELETFPTPLSPAERDAGAKWSSRDQQEHRSCAIASIVASASFLETSLNELYASASHENLEVGGGQGGLSGARRSTLMDVEELIDRNHFLDRFQLTLRLLGAEPFDRGGQPYQDAQNLVLLRNGLIHYKPKFRPALDDPDDKSERKAWQRIEQLGKPLNPFTGPGNPFFPDKCLSHGYTTWAWEAALAFADDFFRRVGVTPPYHIQRNSLQA